MGVPLLAAKICIVEAYGVLVHDVEFWAFILYALTLSMQYTVSPYPAVLTQTTKTIRQGSSQAQFMRERHELTHAERKVAPNDKPKCTRGLGRVSPSRALIIKASYRPILVIAGWVGRLLHIAVVRATPSPTGSLKRPRCRDSTPCLSDKHPEASNTTSVRVSLDPHLL